MKTTIRHNERGFSLIIGMSVLILLTVLGIAVVQGINADVDSAASDRGSQSALAIAEAGLTWSIDYLKRTYGLDTATAQTFTNIVNNAFNDLSNYSDCNAEEQSAIVADPSPASSDWKSVTHNRAAADKNFGGGRYHVWVTKDPADPTGKTLLMRALGIDGRGSQRLVEIAVTAGAGQAL
ncbi:MAG: PilX N-terminal domain-containing pilus assembly protein [Myxococcota bacterium]|nr:pilus assembly PilX N-terminal domain-containing protein [Myxococcota bacterium]